MIRDRLRAILGLSDSPHKIAISFAVGVFIGMSPLLGVHTVLGLLAAWLLRFNRLVTITGVYITNPWSIIPIYTFSTWIGTLILGMDRVIPEIDWGHVTIKILLNDLGHLLLPFVLGTLVVGAVSAVLSYFIIKKAVERARK